MRVKCGRLWQPFIHFADDVSYWKCNALFSSLYFSLSLSTEKNADIFRKKNPMMLFLRVSVYEVLLKWFQFLKYTNKTFLTDWHVFLCWNNMCHRQQRWTCLTCEHGLTLETSCNCICEEAVGQPEELPALCCAVAACCVGITWRARSIVWKEDVL